MDDEFEYSQQGKAAQDLFVSEHATHIVYVEDSDAEVFYERLFQKMFPRLADFDVVCLHGKSNVKKKVHESRVHGLVYIFVVDKDFDDLLGPPSEGLTYLDRYSIENYLVDLNAIIKVFVEENLEFGTAQKIKTECSDYDDFRQKLDDRLVEVTRYFVVVQRRWLEMPSTKIGIEELNEGSSEWHPMPTKEWVTDYRKQVIEKSGLLEGDLNLDLAEAFTPSIDFPEPNMNFLFHVPGKHLLPSLIGYLGIRTVSGFEKRLGKSLYTRILNHIDIEDFAVFKARLLTQHRSLVSFQ